MVGPLSLMSLPLRIQSTMDQKYLEKNITLLLCSQAYENCIFTKHMQIFLLSLFPKEIQYNNHLHSTCIILSIKRNPEMI